LILNNAFFNLNYSLNPQAKTFDH